MKILVTNDDGILSPWLLPVVRTAMQLGEVTVVAPQEQCSAMSQRLTCYSPLCAERKTDFPIPDVSAWSVNGTPTDCVKVAVHFLFNGEKPDLVLSGMNDGYNTGYDIAYSGTLGAAYEAIRMGIPAIAFSCEANGCADTAEKWMMPIAKELLASPAAADEIWNVNFPGLPASACKGILRDRPVAPMQLYADNYELMERSADVLRIREHGKPVSRVLVPDGTDIAAVLDGYISIGKVIARL